ncbi:MAG: hypothetical protein ABIL24_08335 [candidate division WOR-3 bacterium]
MKAIDKIKVICRNCDTIMAFEGENPPKYYLFRCEYCGNRIGLLEEAKKRR